MVKRIINEGSPNKITDPRIYDNKYIVTGQFENQLFEVGQELDKKELEELLNKLLPFEVRLSAKKNR